MTEFNKNYHIPARIVDFQETGNQYLTKAKLEVFYVGETVDKRLFTKEFSEGLIQTLPQMPVVGYYDENEEDFLGHNKEQYVYGYVPETTNLEFRERDGKTFAVTDVILFTGRDDNIGDVASKIVGKAQSLEMDPASVTYKVNKENGKFKNIEFTSGHITGMSVLGDEENPAFSGSHFFKEKLEQQPDYAETFVKFIKEARELFSSSELGGVSMDKFLEKFKTNFDVEAFIKKTYDEERAEVHEALAESRGNQWFHIVQMNSDTVVVYDYETGEFNRANYSRNEETIEFGDSEKVIARYLTEDEIDSTFSTENVQDETETEENEFVAETETVETEEEVVEETFTETETEEEETTEEEAAEETEFVESSSNTHEEELEVEETAEVQETEENFTESDDTSSSETFTSEERAELEEFRQNQKLNILNKYQEYLTDEEVANLTNEMANYSAVTFEKEVKVVAFEAMQKALENKETNQEEPITTFAIGNIESGNESRLDRVHAEMSKYL